MAQADFSITEISVLTPMFSTQWIVCGEQWWAGEEAGGRLWQLGENLRVLLWPCRLMGIWCTQF